MTVGKVTEAFGFVLKEGEFTETILFAEDEIDELKPEERAAVAKVFEHVKACYIELLSECRRVFFEVAKGTAMAPNLGVLTAKKGNGDETIWKRRMVQVPVVLRGNTWLAWVSFGLWATSGPGKSIKLTAHITGQRDFLGLLHEAAREAGPNLRVVTGGYGVEGILPEAGQDFAGLAQTIASRIIPAAAAFHVRISKAAPPTEPT